MCFTIDIDLTARRVEPSLLIAKEAGSQSLPVPGEGAHSPSGKDFGFDEGQLLCDLLDIRACATTHAGHRIGFGKVNSMHFGDDDAQLLINGAEQRVDNLSKQVVEALRYTVSYMG